MPLKQAPLTPEYLAVSLEASKAQIDQYFQDRAGKGDISAHSRIRALNKVESAVKAMESALGTGMEARINGDAKNPVSYLARSIRDTNKPESKYALEVLAEEMGIRSEVVDTVSVLERSIYMAR